MLGGEGGIGEVGGGGVGLGVSKRLEREINVWK